LPERRRFALVNIGVVDVKGVTMSRSVHVVGVGMVPFTKPRETTGYEVMGELAGRAALRDAGVGYDQVQQAYAGWVYGDSTSGQAAPLPARAVRHPDS